MSDLQLFLPCAAGVEDLLADEVHRLTSLAGDDLLVGRAGVVVRAPWREALRLNLHSRLAQRVLVQLSHTPYRQEADLYQAASAVAWEAWFTPRHSFKVEVTAQHSPLKSLNFAALRIKDAVADRFRHRAGTRPDVDTQRPDVRLYAHLTGTHCTLYIDTSGEPLFKRGWREDKGEAPLKETLAAAMIEASGWGSQAREAAAGKAAAAPLYDPCCGSGTIAIEAAQLACGIAPGSLRRFAFEKLLPHQAPAWADLQREAQAAVRPPAAAVFGSDVAFRMVDFANRNAQRAGVGSAVQFRGGDALQRLPPSGQPGVMLVNPPYGERIETAGVAGRTSGGRERAQSDAAAGDFFAQLATHWKRHYPGWTAWVLTPDLKLPSRMRLKESRRVPMWNGPIECRLFRFDMVAGSARTQDAQPRP
ncbi:THUMP domain-containing class I SAM-dependent RNA methyltransferase [Ramlibacter tataouinensis]|uniref:N6-adenine-specific DNA methylase-like protein n=1 Tax=Ramlibacter tataouinensis (strain ATCC BAA-407 / DSM 14655 / LMG 21543 / TTB310) TaxID=365046 RepID=F5Y4N1_RAMTT|nr:THUMP domain-containing protein [Ramlibacter tataouinensis]AEG91349.1 N6-adenine-specific DNA methylase-like protein [Ramlibacter tataouinensis TTB310]